MIETLPKVIQVISRRMRRPADELSAETLIEDIGVDSADLLELIFELEDSFGVELPFTAFDRVPLSTVGDLAMVVSARLPAPG